ncbi:hypothetical protein WN51_10992 [Melipona quadrifasciata]|uniref:Uncharacterized protein n=1 Tax=Melipona quadrifasciata TaxID=166423 RepID=A0A0M9A6P6_9HYME|nr:hypothetical protein WN51_10992 [Melipona quadrifasciata]
MNYLAKGRLIINGANLYFSRINSIMDMKSVGSFYYENFAFPGMVPYKRPAGDKSGMPVYQPTGATTYQQLMQLQQPFVPVSCVVNMASMASMTNVPSVTSMVSNYNASSVAGLNMLNSLGMAASGLPTHLDPAALAKEVAQKNYAKAIKLSQASQASYGINQLTALNYTGVALNKQALILPNPYAVQASIPTVPGAAAAVQGNPYAVQNPYTVLPGVASMPGVAAGVAAAGVPGVPQIPQIPNPATIAAQPQVAIPVSSGVIMQPYKKMKTS